MTGKVIAYITSRRAQGDVLLVFDHRDFPDAGTQVPAGTVEPGEDVLDALRREIAEESGLTQLSAVRPLAVETFDDPPRRVHVFHLLAPPDLPETWNHCVSGAGEDAGLVFVYRWLPRADAPAALAGRFDRWLPLL